MLTGMLFVGVGIYLVAHDGITFLSVAFIIGLMFLVAGVVEVLSYSSYRGDNEERTWILTDGLTTFVLGFLIISNKISTDGIVTGILGLWVLVAGIRNFVHGWESIETRSDKFYDHLIVGALNLVFGLYVFFNADIFDIALITLIGLCIIVQGLNIFHIGATIRIVKPNFIKTKEEKLEEAHLKAQEAHLKAREAIRAAKEAKLELRTVKETPEEELDLVLAPKPGTEKLEEPSEGTEKSEDSSYAAVPTEKAEEISNSEETPKPETEKPEEPKETLKLETEKVEESKEGPKPKGKKTNKGKSNKKKSKPKNKEEK